MKIVLNYNLFDIPLVKDFKSFYDLEKFVEKILEVLQVDTFYSNIVFLKKESKDGK
jgi:hypothetical protein